MKIGSRAVISAKLDRSRINLPPTIHDAEVLVIKPSANVKQRDTEEAVNKKQNTLPDITPVPVKPYGEGWDQMRHGGLPAEQVAFHWADDVAEHKILLFWNSEFPALQLAVDELGRKQVGQNFIEALKEDYLLHLRLMVVSEKNSKHDLSSEQALQLLHRSRADSVRATTLMLTLKTQQYGMLSTVGIEEGVELPAAA